jgi:hypothetical protein
MRKWKHELLTMTTSLQMLQVKLLNNEGGWLCTVVLDRLKTERVL